MTRATYNATDNTLTEISDYGPPPDKPESKFYGNEREMFQRDLAAWRRVMQDFEFHKARYEKTLRTIPCHESARSLWKDGQKVEEGKDYEVVGMYMGTKEEGMYAVPVKSEDDLWREFFNDVYELTGIDFHVRKNSGKKLKQKYSLTKR